MNLPVIYQIMTSINRKTKINRPLKLEISNRMCFHSNWWNRYLCHALIGEMCTCLIADDGGVFKAKGQSRDTRGAKEVRDNGDTKVDLPIDQVRAEEVKVNQLYSKWVASSDMNNVSLAWK